MKTLPALALVIVQFLVYKNTADEEVLDAIVHMLYSNWCCSVDQMWVIWEDFVSFGVSEMLENGDTQNKFYERICEELVTKTTKQAAVRAGSVKLWLRNINEDGKEAPEVQTI